MQGTGLDLGLSRAAAPVTVGSLFREQVLLGGARPALAEGSRVWSYAQLNDRVNQLVHVLASHGVRRGDRIAVLSENRHEYVEAVLASAKLGVLVGCQNWRQSNAELLHCLELADPKLVLCSERLAPALSRLDLAIPSRICFGAEYEKALARAATSEPPEVADPEDGLIIIYTSGTTGLPKAAVISQRAEIMRAMLGRIEPVPVMPDDGFIAWSPMFHVSGMDHTIAAMLRGAKVTIMDGFDADKLVEIASREKDRASDGAARCGRSRHRSTQGERAASAQRAYRGRRCRSRAAGAHRRADEPRRRALLQLVRRDRVRLATGEQGHHSGRRRAHAAVEGAKLILPDPPARRGRLRRRRRRAGRGSLPWSDAVQRLLARAGRERARVPRRLVSSWRCLASQSRRHARFRRPPQVPDQVRRREHLSGGDRACAHRLAGRGRRHRRAQA